MTEPPMSRIDALSDDLISGKRRALAKAITLIESTRADHREQAHALMERLLPHTGQSIRIGITGVPGVGKSTFIEALGLYLIQAGQRVAVLAVDPSSSLTGGSILGDKTRMEELSRRSEAFIRPSPAAGSLGGVAAKTREALFLCEAAGYNVIIVETVGVGQSETTVAGMTDAFVLLQLPNAGDDLQAIKKGVVELADLVVFNKTDIDPLASERAAAQMRSALTMLRGHSAAWKPPVLQVSATQGNGLEKFWQAVQAFQRTLTANGELAAKRRQQALAWMWQLIDAGLRQRFHDHPAIKSELPKLSQAVDSGVTPPTVAAHRLLNLMNRYF